MKRLQQIKQLVEESWGYADGGDIEETMSSLFEDKELSEEGDLFEDCCDVAEMICQLQAHVGWRAYQASNMQKRGLFCLVREMLKEAK